MFFMSDTSDSSSDEESLAKIRLRRKFIRQKSEILSWPDDKFIECFRVNKAAFRYIMEAVEPLLRNGVRTTAISTTLKMASTLLFLAQGSFQFSVGNDFNLGLSQSSVSVSMEESLDVLEKAICPVYLKFGTDEEENETKTEFLNKTGFPGIIGCISGTHFRIMAPCREEQSLYRNKEGNYSLNAMIICDHKMRIRFLDARYAGSYSNANIWNMSLAKHVLSQRYETGERNFCILGDKSFPLEPYLITPFSSPAKGSAEANYNKKHADARKIIEKTITLLKNRFRCLLGTKPLHYKSAKAARIAKVCAALHNLCIEYDTGNFSTENLVENYDSTEKVFKGVEFEDDPTIEALQVREQIKKSLLQ